METKKGDDEMARECAAQLTLPFPQRSKQVLAVYKRICDIEQLLESYIRQGQCTPPWLMQKLSRIINEICRRLIMLKSQQDFRFNGICALPAIKNLEQFRHHRADSNIIATDLYNAATQVKEALLEWIQQQKIDLRSP